MLREKNWSCSIVSMAGWWCCMNGTAGDDSPLMNTGCASKYRHRTAVDILNTLILLIQDRLLYDYITNPVSPSGTWSPACCSRSWRKGRKEPSCYCSTFHMSFHTKMWVKRILLLKKWVTVLFSGCAVTVLLISEGTAVQEHRHQGKRKFRIDRDKLCLTACHPHHHPPLTDVGGTESP